VSHLSTPIAAIFYCSCVSPKHGSVRETTRNPGHYDWTKCTLNCTVMATT
jgi:hypothetical protein